MAAFSTPKEYRVYRKYVRMKNRLRRSHVLLFQFLLNKKSRLHTQPALFYFNSMQLQTINSRLTTDYSPLTTHHPASILPVAVKIFQLIGNG